MFFDKSKFTILNNPVEFFNTRGTMEQCSDGQAVVLYLSDTTISHAQGHLILPVVSRYRNDPWWTEIKWE